MDIRRSNFAFVERLRAMKIFRNGSAAAPGEGDYVCTAGSRLITSTIF